MRGYYERGKSHMKVNEELFWDTFPQLLIDDPKDSNGEIVSILRSFAMSWFAGEKEEDFVGRYFEKNDSSEYEGVGV